MQPLDDWRPQGFSLLNLVVSICDLKFIKMFFYPRS